MPIENESAPYHLGEEVYYCYGEEITKTLVSGLSRLNSAYKTDIGVHVPLTKGSCITIARTYNEAVEIVIQNCSIVQRRTLDWEVRNQAHRAICIKALEPTWNKELRQLRTDLISKRAAVECGPPVLKDKAAGGVATFTEMPVIPYNYLRPGDRAYIAVTPPAPDQIVGKPHMYPYFVLEGTVDKVRFSQEGTVRYDVVEDGDSGRWGQWKMKSPRVFQSKDGAKDAVLQAMQNNYGVHTTEDRIPFVKSEVYKQWLYGLYERNEKENRRH